jgi:hypothetical protein
MDNAVSAFPDVPISNILARGMVGDAKNDDDSAEDGESEATDDEVSVVE